MDTNHKADAQAAAKDESGEALKRFTKADLQEHLKTHPQKKVRAVPAAAAAEAALAKPALATLVETGQQPPRLDQPFERSFAKTPCKPNVDAQPRTKFVAVMVIILVFTGAVVYVLVKNYLDTNKPHPLPKNFPMRVIEGQHVYQN